MFKNIYNDLENIKNNFDINDIISYQLLLIKIQQITYFLENNSANCEEKQKIVEIYKSILDKFNLKKIIQIKDLNELFGLEPNQIDISNFNIYHTLFNIILQEWESDDNIFSMKVKEVLNIILERIMNDFNINPFSNSQQTNTLSQNNISKEENPIPVKYEEDFPSMDSFTINNKTYLREYIIQKKLLKYECCRCGLSSWQNNPLLLQIYSFDGIYNNNNLKNIVFLCPNCYSQIGD